MISILLDSSSTKLSVALAKDNIVIDSVSYEAWQKQSELMIPELSKLLDKHAIERKDIKEVLLGIGPGSYTGVRIAVSIAKIIAIALSIPIYSFSSLHILKNEDKPSICLINARSNRSYFGVYKGKDIIVSDTIKTNEEVLEYIKEHKKYSICGDVSYLGLKGENNDIFKQMISLKDEHFKKDNPLIVNPIYLKD